MTERLDSAMTAWYEAEAQARAAEDLLHAAWHREAADPTAAITAQLIDDVARLRDRANDKLTVVLALLHR